MHPEQLLFVNLLCLLQGPGHGAMNLPTNFLIYFALRLYT